MSGAPPRRVMPTAITETPLEGQGFSGPKRILYAGMAPLLPLILLARLVGSVSKKRRKRRRFLGSLPLIVLPHNRLVVGRALGYLAGGRATRVEAEPAAVIQSKGEA